jgi:transglutaminase-like putative cysteine protease/tetratricopeptide (TPR) repeat protein
MNRAAMLRHVRVELDLAESFFVVHYVLLKNGEQRFRLLRAEIDALKVIDLNLRGRLLLEGAEYQKEIPNVHAYLHAVGVVFAIVLVIDELDVGLRRRRHEYPSILLCRKYNNQSFHFVAICNGLRRGKNRDTFYSQFCSAKGFRMIGFRARLSMNSLLVCLLSVATLAVAQSSSGPSKEIERFSDAAVAAYQAAAGENVTPSSTDALVLVDEDEYVFDDQGRATHKQYLVYKVLTQKGANDWEQISAQWEPWNEERPEIRARVISSAGERHQLDPKTVADSPADENDGRIYSDRRVLRAPLPAIAPGSLVEQEQVSKERVPFFGAGSVHRVFFGRFVPVKRTRLVLDAPASLPLHYELKLLPNLKPQRIEGNGRVKIVFESAALEALEDADSYLPSEMPAYPYVAFSTAASWQHVAEEYARIVDNKISTSDVTALAAKVTAGKTSREQKASAILQYLSREIRYTGVEFGDAAIIPRTPGETLKQKYGDCKDKATLLIAMLQAAGIPAHLALLNAGSREDVSASLPGMGSFDHAIVYAPGSPELWIDATDEYARLGQLPDSDQGRRALVARTGSQTLLRTPVSSSQENLLVEKRLFYLAEHGPARVVEISLPQGELESEYRQEYADKGNEKHRKNLTAYVENQYLAEKLDRIDRTDPRDLSTPFQLEVEVKKAKRGATDLEVAVAAIRLESLFNRLPSELRQRKEKEDENPAGDKSEGKPKRARTADYQLPRAFATEWRYEIVPPLGFRPKPLPKNMRISLGPALLTGEFSANEKGVVNAVLRFDTVKRRLTVAEANEMRDRIVELSDAEATFVYFEPVAQILFREGKLRESFAAYRKLITEHPKEAVHHLQIAIALLNVGMGEAARDEARLGVRLEPGSALAQKTLAEILEHDLVGRKFRRGAELAGAEAALRAAVKLDPEDKTTTGNLAILLEYNIEGERYGTGAKLKAAVETYRSLKPEELAEIGLKNNLPFALVYAEDFEGAKKVAEALNPQPTAVIIAAEAAMNGAAAGIREAQKRIAAESEVKQTLKTAGEILMRLRRYSVAADLLQAGASGDNASGTVSLASMLRQARPRQSLRFGDDPTGVVMRMFRMVADDELTLDMAAQLESSNANKITARTDPEKLQEQLKAGRQLRTSLSRTGLPIEALLDVVMQVIEPKQEGDDTVGYRVTLRVPGTKNPIMYVVKEQGSYKLLDSSEKTNAAGLEILDRLRTNNLSGARQLLDWIREDQPLAGGDDPLAGNPFPRFWTQGKEADAQQMKLACAALLVQTKETAQDGLPILEAALPAAKNDGEKVNISIALLTGYFNLDSYEKILPVATELAKQYPESRRAFAAQIAALRGLARFQLADDLAENRLKRIPNDLPAMRALVQNAVARADYALARRRNVQIVSAVKAEAEDFNNSAWYSLFVGTPGNEDIETAIKGARLQQNNAGILHTLGCIYAELGKTKEAREVLVQGMDILSLDEPNSVYWYAFGRIAEQYGELKIAASNYARVTKPTKPIDIPGSTYQLAQNRLKVLASVPNQGDSKSAGKP